MGDSHRHDSLRRKMKPREQFPQVHVDRDLDFASIKLSPGVEVKSYVKDGLVFCEDKKGQITEIQILNLSALMTAGEVTGKKRTKKTA